MGADTERTDGLRTTPFPGSSFGDAVASIHEIAKRWGLQATLTAVRLSTESKPMTQDKPFAIYCEYDGEFYHGHTEAEALEKAAQLATKNRGNVYVFRAVALVSPKYDVKVTPWMLPALGMGVDATDTPQPSVEG